MAETKTKPKKSKSKDPFKKHGVSPELARDLMRDMLLYRRFEEKAEEAYAIGKIGGFCHIHIGQEAAAAGSIKPLREDDYVMSAYREHTQAIAKGCPPNEVMAELYGRAAGSSGGKGGSMHIFDDRVRFMGGHGIVGGQVPLATGIGFKIKYRKEDTVSLVFMGDAAVNQGGFHEALNMAAIWELPMIYVVENNAYGMGTAFNRVSVTGMEVKSASHGIPAHTVNGQDVLETYAFFRDLAAEVRTGAGPQFVNLETVRFRGHSMSDAAAGTYRPIEELENAKENKDPIIILRDYLFAGGHLGQEELDEMDTEAKQIAEDAADFADNAPEPGPEALYSNVWAEINEHGRLFFDGRER